MKKRQQFSKSKKILLLILTFLLLILVVIFGYMGQNFSTLLKSSRGVKSESKPVNNSQLPETNKIFTSKLANFTLTIPPGNYSEIVKKADYEHLVIWITPQNYTTEGEQKLELTIHPVVSGCVDQNQTWGNPFPTTARIGGKYPVDLMPGSISHGDAGRWLTGVSKTDNGYCIEVSIKYHRNYENQLLKVLNGN